MRSDLEVADIFRRHGHAYRHTNDGHLGHIERRVMSAIELCRTAALGGHVEACEDCAHVLHAGWDTHRVNHSARFMDDGVCTNQAESFFSRLRRMEVGTHHHIAGPYIGAYAGEASWREDHRRVSNGTQAAMVTASAMASRVSRQWKGYWQRAA